MGLGSSKPEAGNTVVNGDKKVAYDVYGREINPDNQMPSNPNQVPLADQKKPLSTQRVHSSIPKGGTDGTWTYPSPQMFFNSLKRKGKGDGVREEDMDVVIAIHNNMNERTWKLLLQWEQQRAALGDPKLLKFQGKPHTLSPKARLWSLLGYEKPFDRHDWIVERGEKKFRYVIDYYHIEEGASQDRIPGLNDNDSVRSIFVDVRPALDDWQSIALRLNNVMSFTGQKLPGNQSEDEISKGKQIVEESINVSPQDMRQYLGVRCIRPITDFIQCADATGDATGEKECAKEFLGANFCMGSVICPDISQKLLSTLQNDPDSADNVLMEMQSCIRDSRVAQDVFAQAVSHTELKEQTS